MEKLHPKAVWLFFWHFLLIGLFAFIAVLFFFFPALLYEFVGVPWGWLVLIFLLGVGFYVVFCYVWAKLTYQFWRYQLEKDVIKIEKGVIWKKYVSIPYERIQNVDIYRGVFARILGLSELHIQTAGHSGQTWAEGKLPGLDIQVAERLRDELIKKVKGTEQGL